MKFQDTPRLILTLPFALILVAYTASPLVLTTYAFHSYNGSKVKVSESLNGELLGTHYLCNVQNLAVCTVTSETTPGSNGEIPLVDVVDLHVNRVFVDLYLPSQGDTD